MHEADPHLRHTAPDLPAPIAMDRVDTEIYLSFHLGYSSGLEIEAISSLDRNHYVLSIVVAKTATIADQHPNGNPSSCAPLCHI